MTGAEKLVGKANPEDLDYNSATDDEKNEMWTFTHPETEQTDALTDYRYIGANPNNYVEFNDEIWRIIGVFTVDDGTGKMEQRIKLIRNESIGSNMAWDSNNTNDWVNATLNANLNSGDYWTNSLENETKNMIGNTLWYLGGSDTFDDVTTPMFYERERGVTVYCGRNTSWVGKVGLMYPSDYGYATSGGSTIDRNSCLKVPISNWNISYSDCKNNDWLYNEVEEWTISPFANNSYHIISIDEYGSISVNYASNYRNGVHPVVYLKSNVVITGGDGTENNLFTLS